MRLTIGFLIIFCACSSSTAADWGSFKEKHIDLTPTIPRIIGGNEATPNQFPFQVGLLINGNSFCGGSLISPSYVLTAAHCAIVVSTTVDVILGAHNITAKEETQVHLSAQTIHVHEKFNYVDYQYDIALIKLSAPVTLNDYIQTIALPSRSDVNTTYDEKVVTSVGWGITADVDHNPTLDDLSPVLKYVEIAVQDLDDCKDYYNRNSYDINYVTELNICTTGYKNKGTCNGDSGGPLIHDNVQIGLVSIGTTLCELCSPSIFTKIAAHLDWIQEHSDVIVN